jgi:hypothetical protein
VDHVSCSALTREINYNVEARVQYKISCNEDKLQQEKRNNLFGSMYYMIGGVLLIACLLAPVKYREKKRAM